MLLPAVPVTPSVYTARGGECLLLALLPRLRTLAVGQHPAGGHLLIRGPVRRPLRTVSAAQPSWSRLFVGLSNVGSQWPVRAHIRDVARQASGSAPRRLVCRLPLNQRDNDRGRHLSPLQIRQPPRMFLRRWWVEIPWPHVIRPFNCDLATRGHRSSPLVRRASFFLGTALPSSRQRPFLRKHVPATSSRAIGESAYTSPCTGPCVHAASSRHSTEFPDRVAPRGRGRLTDHILRPRSLAFLTQRAWVPSGRKKIKKTRSHSTFSGPIRTLNSTPFFSQWPEHVNVRA